MEKGKLTSKIFGIVLACLLVGGMSCGLTDYVGVDVDGDGISDTPYGIDSDNDNYPLVEPFENGGATGVSLTTALYLVYQADLSDVEPGKEDEIMEGVKGVIERRIDALGYESIVRAEKHEREWSIAIQLPGIIDSEKVKEMVGLVTVLEFREWDEARKEWVPATGTVTVDGEQKELVLSSRYFVERTYVTLDERTRSPLLIFEWDETGQELSRQITGRLINKPLAIFLGDEPLLGEDGSPIAPVVREVIEERGQIDGLSLADAQMLSRFLNTGRIPVPLGRWVEEGQSKVFEPNVPLYEGQVTPTPPIKWLPVGGIIGAVVVAGLVIFFVRRRRAA